MRGLVAVSLAMFWGAATYGQVVSPGETLIRTYRVEADLRRVQSRQFSAKIEIDLEHRGQKPLSEIALALYPNRFQETLPNLDDLNMFRVYPSGVSKGEMTLEKVEQGEKSLTATPISVAKLPEGTFVRVALAEPLLPGARTTLRLAYQVKVPEKYGSFGFYRGALTMAGGWTPQVVARPDENGFNVESAAPLSTWQLKILADAPTWVAGTLHSPPNDGSAIHADWVGHDVTVLVSHKLRQEEIAGRRSQVRLVYFRGEKGWITSMRELAVKWIEYVDVNTDLPRIDRPVVLAEAPLREMLATQGDGVTLVSDRAFKLIKSVRRYHSVPILRGLFYQLIEPSISRREQADDFNWVSEAIGWQMTEDFIATQEFQYRDARDLPPVRFLSFLFIFDRLIYAPQFAFFDVFYDFIYPYDPVRDHPLRFNHRRPFGRTIFAHLEDEIGVAEAAKAARLYVASDAQSFEDVAATVAGRPLEAQFAQWKRPRPAVNYAIKKHRTWKTEGGFRHELTIRRTSQTPVHESCEVLIVTKSGETKVLKWETTESEKVFEFETTSKVKLIEIDPRGRLLETTLSDNRSPPKYKLTVTDYIVSYDFNRNVPTGFVSTQFRRSYGGSNRYNLFGSYLGESYGVGVSYVRLFGQLVDSLRLSHGLGIGYDFRQIGDEFVGVLAPATTTTTVVQTGPSMRTSSVSASYFFGSQLSLTNPLEGGGSSLTASWGNAYLGGQVNYYRLTLDSSWIWPIHPSYFMAFRGLVGHVGPGDLPSQLSFDLGGLTTMRGFSQGDPRFSGRQIALLSGEFRHLLLRDIDVNVWLFRLRDVQGALFADAGRVTSTVAQQAERLAGIPFSQTSLGDLFDYRDFEADAGYGIRLHVDWLGVNPGLMAFDVAKSVTVPGTARFYFGVTQSF